MKPAIRARLGWRGRGGEQAWSRNGIFHTFAASRESGYKYILGIGREVRRYTNDGKRKEIIGR